MRFAHAAWLLPPAFALHVAEEAPGFTDWARRNASPRYSQRDFVVNNALGMAMTVAATAAISRRPGRRAFLVYDSLVLTQQALWNTAFHAATAVAWRERSPGLVTAVGLFLPVRWAIGRAARREGLTSQRGTIAAVAMGGLVHASAVRHQVLRR